MEVLSTSIVSSHGRERGDANRWIGTGNGIFQISEVEGCSTRINRGPGPGNVVIHSEVIMRKILFGAVVVLVVCNKGSADQFTGSIQKIENGKVTVRKITQNQKGKVVVLKAADKITVNRLKLNFARRTLEESKPFSNGLKNKAFTRIGKKGLAAQIVTNDANQVIKITLFPPGFKIRVKPKD